MQAVCVSNSKLAFQLYSREIYVLTNHLEIICNNSLNSYPQKANRELAKCYATSR